MHTLRALCIAITFCFCLFCLGCGSGMGFLPTNPQISQISPQTIPAGTQATTIKVTGTNFQNQSVILWNGGTLTTSVVDSNTLAATVGGQILSTPGVAQLKVQNGQGEESAAMPVNVTASGSTSPQLTISSSSLSSGLDGTAYTATLQATGGTPSYTWSISSGSLPSGLSLSATSGIVSGTPTTGGTFSFTVTVTDNSSPSQSQSAETSITVATAPVSTPSPLAITSSDLSSGHDGTAYAAILQASGGTPAYTWSISSGSLPSGLNLAATTGVISGTPTASGTFNFTARVIDNGSPAQSQTAETSITVAAAAQASTTPGTTWYVRPDGGTRFSANVPTGQCDGMADVSYASTGGAGVNQHCAFNDVRYLWADGSYAVDPTAGAPAWGWIGAGGDTYLIRGGPWRVGQSGPNVGDYFGLAGDPYAAGAPPPLSGTSGAHTRILGENYASCHAQSARTQLHGGYGIGAVLAMNGVSYVDVACLDLTDYSSCGRSAQVRIHATLVPP